MTEEIEGANSSTSQCVPVVAEMQNPKLSIIGKAGQKYDKNSLRKLFFGGGVAFT